VAVGDDVVIGEGASVARSVIWAGEKIDAGSMLNRAIVAGGQVVSA
jgi:NDP-sugar pyrophosphorylase family protein